jgi:superfamily II DNA or RNA helicase
MKLFPDQLETLDKVRSAYKSGFRRPLLVSPTGSGKTVMFSEVSRGASAKGTRVIQVCHRQELVDQINRANRDMGIVPGIIAAGYPESPGAMVQIASVATLIRRLERVPEPGLLVIDEAHHCTLNTLWGRVLSHWPKARALGVTATPTRLSGEGLGDIFDTMIQGLTVQQLIDIGRLAPVSVYAPSDPDLAGVHTAMGDFNQRELAVAMGKPTVTGDAVDHYRKYAHKQPAIAFCVSVEHARQVAQKFRDGGYHSVTIDGALDSNIRRQIVADFTAGKIDVLTSCELISEGFDIPRVQAGILLRPTQSLGLHLQQCGRILRAYPGKSRAIILDHAGNSNRFGLPTDDREWTLDAARHAKRNAGSSENVPGVRTCKKCFSASKATALRCRDCGEPFPVDARKVKHVEGELQELTSGSAKPRRQANPADDLAGLTELGKMRGYKDPARWAQHILDARHKKKTHTGHFNGTP